MKNYERLRRVERRKQREKKQQQIATERSSGRSVARSRNYRRDIDQNTDVNRSELTFLYRPISADTSAYRGSHRQIVELTVIRSYCIHLISLRVSINMRRLRANSILSTDERRKHTRLNDNDSKFGSKRITDSLVLCSNGATKFGGDT